MRHRVLYRLPQQPMRTNADSDVEDDIRLNGSSQNQYTNLKYDRVMGPTKKSQSNFEPV